MAYIQGESRSQTSLFPISLEELIPEDHLVWVLLRQLEGTRAEMALAVTAYNLNRRRS